jgi:hypothetical protein
MASMHINDDKPLGSNRATEVPPSYTPASSDNVFDERISHVVAKYRGTTTDQHGQYGTIDLIVLFFG